MPARMRQSSMVAVRRIQRGTALVPAHATAANVPTRGEPAQCDVRAPRSSPFLARSGLMRRHLIAAVSPGRSCGPWTVLPFLDARADRLEVLCESESRMPNPLFIVSHAHVNKKQRRIAVSMQKFSRVVQCDAFMPHIEPLPRRIASGEGAARAEEDSVRFARSALCTATSATSRARFSSTKNRRGVAAAAAACSNPSRLSFAGRSPRTARSPARYNSPSAGSACCRCVAQSHGRPSRTCARSRTAA